MPAWVPAFSAVENPPKSAENHQPVDVIVDVNVNVDGDVAVNPRLPHEGSSRDPGAPPSALPASR